MYSKIARYYDAVHAHLSDDIDLVLSLAAECGTPILEIGCGSGRVLLPLAMAGYQITGVDNSEAMLALARQKIATAQLAHHVTLFNVDALTLELDERNFQLAFFSHNTAQTFSQSQLSTILQRVRVHLAGNACLLLDFTSPFIMINTPDSSEYVDEGSFIDPVTNRPVAKSARWQHDIHNQVVRVDWRYAVSEDDVITFQAHYHYLYPHQLYPLLQRAGFSWEASYGNYDQQPFDENSTRLIVVARAA